MRTAGLGERFRRDVCWILGLTVLFEAVTCLFRFGLRMQSTRDTGVLRHLTFGLRIHHGYIGLLLVLFTLLLPRGSSWQMWCLRVGAALVLSDLVHHFLVLWPITGDPAFDLTYPP
jgi:hypothetical protein